MAVRPVRPIAMGYFKSKPQLWQNRMILCRSSVRLVGIIKEKPMSKRRLSRDRY